MKPTLQRSITFWSGLLMMAFVYWAWWDSASYVSEASSGRMILANSGAGISLRTVDLVPTRFERELEEEFLGRFGEFPQPFILTHAAAWKKCSGNPFGYYGEAATWRDYWEELIAYGMPGDWMVFLPHWLILLTVAARWLGLLFWRARRRTRTSNS